MMLGNILFLLFFGAVFYMVMKSGGDNTGKNNKPDIHGSSDGATAIDKDPVCGMEVKKHLIASSHFGRDFHFCSEQCRKIFNLNPNKHART